VTWPFVVTLMTRPPVISITGNSTTLNVYCQSQILLPDMNRIGGYFMRKNQ